MRSSGSMTLPNDLDIFLPYRSRTKPWLKTTRNGTSPRRWSPAMSIRLTQKVLMS